MKIKFLKRKKSWKKEKESFWLNINFYWKFSLFFMLATFLASLFFGYYLFMQIKKEPMLSSDNTDGLNQAIKKERIEKVLQYFSVRKQKSDQILNNSASVADPSL